MSIIVMISLCNIFNFSHRFDLLSILSYEWLSFEKSKLFFSLNETFTKIKTELGCLVRLFLLFIRQVKHIATGVLLYYSKLSDDVVRSVQHIQCKRHIGPHTLIYCAYFTLCSDLKHTLAQTETTAITSNVELVLR